MVAATVITALAHTSPVLGNVRSVVREDGAVVESNEYYPYGGLFSATPSVQPYKYGAKELDRTHGLDWYDFGARMHDAMLTRWGTIDPFAEKYYQFSPYAYCAANPIRFTDFNGEEYGDTFSTKDSAAIDFGMIYNRLSILFNIEYTTNIYSFTKPNGEPAYSYTLPQKGTSKTGGKPIDPQYGETIVARAHTHAAYDRKYNNDVFSGETSTAEGNRHSSDGDLLVYNLTEVDGYVSTPNGSLRKYDYNTGVVSIISTQMPNDFRDKSSSMYEELILLLNQLKDAINHK